MGAETHIDIRRFQGRGGGQGDFYLISSDDSINVTPIEDGYDLTLNTSIVELIDFTNFHNTYMGEVQDWGSQYGSSLHHHVVHCSLADEDMTIVDTSQAGTSAAAQGFTRSFYFERSVASNHVVYIPLIAITGTDFICSINVKIKFGIEGNEYLTKCILLGDNPTELSWCFTKNIPFNLVGRVDDKQPYGQLYEFIEIPAWFVGRVEVSLDKMLRQVFTGHIFSLHQDLISGIMPTNFDGGDDDVEMYAFTSLNSYTYIDEETQQSVTRTLSEIQITPVDNYGVIDVDFFVDDISVLEIQSDNTIPDWIINDLCVHELLLQSKMKDIIIKNIQSNQIVTTNVIDQNSTNDEVPSAKAVYDFVTSLINSNN